MVFEQEINLFNPNALERKFHALDTQFNVTLGKISAIISDSDIEQYQDGHTTMHSRLSAMSQDLDGFHTQVSEMQTEYDEEFGRVDSRLTTFDQTLESIQMGVSTVSQEAIKIDTIYYLATSQGSGVTRSTSGWTTTTQSISSTNKYLWIYHKYTKGDDSVSYTDPCIAGVWGNTGAKGDKGDAGDATPSYWLDIAQSFITKKKDGTLSPASITAKARTRTGTGSDSNYSGRFSVGVRYTGRSLYSIMYTSSADETSCTYTLPSKSFDSVRVWLFKSGTTIGAIDVQTLDVVEEGSDAYTVVLSNESHTFAGNTSSAVVGSTECSIIAMKGANRVAATIGTITGQTTGMTTSISNNGTISAKFTVSVTTSMVTRNGTLTIPVTVDGKVFNMTFSYSLALKGQDGTPGRNGIDGSSSYVHIKYSPVANPTDSQMTETPSAYIGICSDQNVADPSTASSYTWSKWEGKDGTNGTPGTNGTNGRNAYVHFAYANSADGRTDFSTTPFTGAKYVGLRTDETITDSTNPADYDWSEFKGDDGQDGRDGQDGAHGINTATVYLYRRSAGTPMVVNKATTYTFSTKTLSGDPGRSWEKTIPSGTEKLWITVATASSSTDTDVIEASEWSTPVELSHNGADGSDGSDGLDGYNKAVVQLYQRATSTPSKPSTFPTYTFSTGQLSSVPSGWSTTIPATNGNPCYVIAASLVSRNDSITVTPASWSSPVKMVEDGEDGIGILETVSLRYAGSSTTAPAKPTSEVTSTSTAAGQWTKAVPALSNTYKYMYTCDQIKWDGGAVTWSDPVRNNALTDLVQRVTAAELKITDSAIVATVRNSSEYQQDLAALEITDQHIISTVTSSGFGELVTSAIEQTATGIHLKAKYVSWDSTYSSMTQDGHLTLINAAKNTKSELGVAPNFRYSRIEGRIYNYPSSGLCVSSLSQTSNKYAFTPFKSSRHYKYTGSSSEASLILNNDTHEDYYYYTSGKYTTHQKRYGKVFSYILTNFNNSDELNVNSTEQAYAHATEDADQGLLFGSGGIGCGNLTTGGSHESGEYINDIPIDIKTFAHWGFIMNSTNLRIQAGSTLIMSGGNMTINGKTVAFASSSSERYKHSIELLSDAGLDPHKLYDLKPKQYEFNDTIVCQYDDMKGRLLPGFIAEDVAEIYPSAVIRNSDGQVENWDERRIIPAMLALIQEQNERIKALERMVN